MLPWVEPADGDPRGGGASARGPRLDAPGPMPAPPRAASSADHFARLVQMMLDRGLNLHDPRYIGHQVPAPVPLAGLFDAVGSVTNQVHGHLRDGALGDGRRAGHGRASWARPSAGSRTPSPAPSPTAARWPTSPAC